MPTVVGVRFKPATKMYYFSPGEMWDLQVGEFVVVETARGQELGEVVAAARDVPDDDLVSQLKPVLRRATAWDASQACLYRAREREALARCREKVREHHLPMKLIAAEYSFDGSRLVFFFTAEKRVDFRGLVRDLARLFKTRIELRQVGVRDEAKIRGGIGPCGRALCCETWLTDFNPVSIRMAKDQDMPLNPADISGLCGRLLCCLAYESEHYAEVKSTLPKYKSVVETPHGSGVVVGVNVLKETVDVQLESSAVVEVGASDLAGPEKPPRRAKKRGRKRRDEEGDDTD
ncbi:MAG: stage 0 sporulation family protein [Chloroflexi bacterium]|nr:stage 0 sporulation family protein [Chloroflexota bacterium]